MSDWNDHVVGDRMTVDQEFSERVQASDFTSQEWGLIMTATEFEIDEPGTDDAQIVANTENLPQMMPELENVRRQIPGPGGNDRKDPSSGVIATLKDALGLDGSSSVDEERLAEARRLTQEYAKRFQQHLEKRGKWDDVQEIAMQRDPSSADEAE